MSGKYLGFDTSNYTTSAALYGGGMQNERLLLPVKAGAYGLRQNEAVFLHCRQMPEVYARLGRIDGVCAVGVSVRPRNTEGSYMPCFLAGKAFAQIVGATLDVPVYTYSHQQGHISAALYSMNRLDLINKPFLAFHLSGGTMELLQVRGISDLSLIHISMKSEPLRNLRKC